MVTNNVSHRWFLTLIISVMNYCNIANAQPKLAVVLHIIISLKDPFIFSLLIATVL
jgi:hypothetical protein